MVEVLPEFVDVFQLGKKKKKKKKLYGLFGHMPSFIVVKVSYISTCKHSIISPCRINFTSLFSLSLSTILHNLAIGVTR